MTDDFLSICLSFVRFIFVTYLLLNDFIPKNSQNDIHRRNSSIFLDNKKMTTARVLLLNYKTRLIMKAMISQHKVYQNLNTTVAQCEFF